MRAATRAALRFFKERRIAIHFVDLRRKSIAPGERIGSGRRAIGITSSVGQEIIIEFVDTCMCGEYHMTMDRSEKDALLMTPNAGLTMWEQMGMSNKSQRFNGNGLERLGLGPDSTSQAAKQFDRLEQFAKLQKPPVIKFKDLEASVNSTI